MTTAFQCPRCGFRFRVKEEFLGRIAKCPQCSQKMKLSAPAAPQSSPLPPAGPAPEPATNPGSLQTASVSDNGEMGTSSLTMTVPPRTEKTPSPAARDFNPQLEPDTNPELRSPATATDDSVSRVAARRASRRVVRNKLKNPSPQVPNAVKQKKPLNPAWYGFAVAIVVGLTGWGAYAMFFPDKAPVEEVAGAGDPDSPIKIDGQTVALSDAAAEDQANPTVAASGSQSAETPQQVAAKQEAKRQAEEKAARSGELKKK